MTWAVRVTYDGGQRDGRMQEFAMIEDFAQLDALVSGKHVLEISMVRAEHHSAAQIVFERAMERGRR